MRIMYIITSYNFSERVNVISPDSDEFSLESSKYFDIRVIIYDVSWKHI